MIHCKEYVNTASLLSMVFLFGVCSVARGKTIRGDIGGPSGAGVADDKVNVWDLSVLAGEWLSSDPCFADICGSDGNSMPDGIVNLWDYAVLANYWMFNSRIIRYTDFLEDFSDLTEGGWSVAGA
jgi:hypothetical protein